MGVFLCLIFFSIIDRNFQNEVFPFKKSNKI